MEIITLLTCISSATDYTTIRQLSNIAEAMLAMTGRITMRGMTKGLKSMEVIEPFNASFTAS